MIWLVSNIDPCSFVYSDGWEFSDPRCSDYDDVAVKYLGTLFYTAYYGDQPVCGRPKCDSLSHSNPVA